MPRKTKEMVSQNDKEIKDEEIKKLAKKSSKIDSAKEEKKTSKKSKTSDAKTASDVNAKKGSKSSEKAPAKTSRKATTQKASTAKATKATPKAKTTKTKSTTSEKAKTTTKRTKKAEQNYIVEYYDLPYRYNHQTVVKLLAQTPNSLFVYWDISDLDRENYIKNYGEDFFNTTKPVLKIYNDTLNYNFEVEVDDFANGWYIRINDADCVYRVELARRPKYYNSGVKDNYIYITSSNKMDAPNDHILFEKITPDFNFKFRNVKNNKVTYKNISGILNGKNVLFQNNFMNLTQLYSLIYEKQNIEELYNHSNPSSNFSSRN